MIQEEPEHLEQTKALNTGMNFEHTMRSIPGSAGTAKRPNEMLLKPENIADGDNRTEEAHNSLESRDSKPISRYSKQETIIEKVESPHKAKIVDTTNPVSLVK